MTVQQNIEEKIQALLTPTYLDVLNESHMHSVPPGSESHFKLVIVSAKFENQSRLQRHQKVNEILAKELKDDLHALSMETHTTQEWEQRGGKTLESPLCHGGSKADGAAKDS